MYIQIRFYSFLFEIILNFGFSVYLFIYLMLHFLFVFFQKELWFFGSTGQVLILLETKVTVNTEM